MPCFVYQIFGNPLLLFKITDKFVLLSIRNLNTHIGVCRRSKGVQNFCFNWSDTWRDGVLRVQFDHSLLNDVK